MAILKTFDPANYETKTITLAVSAGSSYTLGDAYSGGGRVVDIWGAEGFSSSVGAKEVDYVLTGIDSRLSTDYGTTYYTVFKSVTITGTVTITYRRYGTYVDAGQINQHETRLGVHDSRLTSVESVNTTQNNRLSAIETKNGEQDADISALESGLSDETAARQTHESNTTDAHGATSEATANKMMIRDANARVQIAAGADNLDAVNKAQMDAAISAAVVAAGSGDMTGPSSAVSGHIPLFSGSTGKIIEDSGVAPSDLYASACATQEVTTADVTITDVKKGTLILTGAPTGNRVIYLQAAVWRKTIICDCTGSYYIQVKTASGTGVYLAPGDVAEVYCDGMNIIATAHTGCSYIGVPTPGTTVTALTNAAVPVTTSYNPMEEMTSGGVYTPKNSGYYDIHMKVKFNFAANATPYSYIRFGGIMLSHELPKPAFATAYSQFLQITRKIKLVAGTSYQITVYFSEAVTVGDANGSYIEIYHA